MVAFQVGGSFAKGLFPAVGPLGAATLRLCIGAAILLVVSRPWRNLPKHAPWWALVGLGISTVVAITSFYAALARLPQGVAVALQFLGPLSIALFGSRRPIDLLWAGLAGFGVWALVGARVDGPALDPLGIAWALAAAAGWTGYILFGRSASTAFGGAAGALSTGIAAVVILPFGVAHAGTALLAPALLPLAFMVALFTTAIPFTLELYALRRLPSRTFAVLMSLEPAFAVMSGLFVLHEALVRSQIVGVAAVMIAAVGSTLSTRVQAQPPLT